MQQGAAAVVAEEALADEGFFIGENFADLQDRLLVLELLEVAGHPVHEGEVGVGQRSVGALDGEEDAAGEHVLREGLFEQLIAADAGAAGGQEADVVVLNAVAGGRGEEGNAGPEEEPGGADQPGILGGEAAESFEHARRLPERRQPEPSRPRTAGGKKTASAAARSRRAPHCFIGPLMGEPTGKGGIRPKSGKEMEKGAKGVKSPCARRRPPAGNIFGIATIFCLHPLERLLD